MKTRAIIQARMLSSRLRGKSLMAVAGKPLLLRVLERIDGLDFVDEVVVATTIDAADEPIEALVTSRGWGCVRGDRTDVLDRFVQAAFDLDDSDCILRYTADNPLYDPHRTAQAFQVHLDAKADYTHIDGLSHMVPEFIRVGCLREAARTTEDAFDREHVTPFLRKSTDRFQVQKLPADFADLRPDHDQHLTIDNSSQLAAFETMLEHVEPDGKLADLDECYAWLDRRGVGLPTSSNSSVAEAPPLRIKLAGHEVGDGCPCFIVAEIGQNHNGQIGMAKRLIDMAADCGCDAVKFQKRDIRWELTDEAYNRPYDNPNSFGKTYGLHREFLELDEEQHTELREYAVARGLVYFCTACDPPSVELMERVDNPVYKIASRDITNIPLLHCVAQTGKPVIISTGMAGTDEIRDALDALGSSDVLITHCVSQYPTQIENVNLLAMDAIREEFHLPVGLSDHTTGVITCVAAASMGACFIEKHVTMSRAMQGTDHAAALEEEGLRRLVRYIRTCAIAMGEKRKFYNPVVDAAKAKLARSLTSAVTIPSGSVLTEEMITLKSPGDGLPWRERDQLLGKRAKADIPVDQTLTREHFE
ncbi:MAG: N-acetylneuraminate synthase family protein [Planctomycetota bacterium]